jgi:CRP/FNR family cyclic AMP-dependent transcriptional regulator
MKKILIIEDNLQVRENTAEIIELSNYEVITAENGKMGVELALKEHPDLILCDIMMPVLDGYGVCHLLGKHKETASIPFIFLTAKSEKSDFRRGMEMGVDDYITKPFEGIDLLNAIEIRLKKNETLKQQYGSPEVINELITNEQKSGKIQLTSDERDVYNYNKKHVLYKEGQRARILYYVVSGKVKVSKSNQDGKELITNIIGPGDFFGYTAILEDENYKEEAQVLEETELMQIPREDFMRLLWNDIETARTFIKIITHNIAEKEESMINLAYSSLRRKVAYALTQLYEKYKLNDGMTPVLNLSRENMAQSIGIATESLIRTLADFKEEKLIDIDNGKVSILNGKKLLNLPY